MNWKRFFLFMPWVLREAGCGKGWVGMQMKIAWLWLLVVVGIAPIWANSFITREGALKSLDALIARARTHLNEPRELADDLENNLVNVKDHQKVYQFYTEILEKSMNSGCVWIALKNLPNDLRVKGKKARQAARLKTLKPLITHESLWVRLAVAGQLDNADAQPQARLLYLSLASLADWQIQVEREALMLGRPSSNLKYEWVLGVVGGLLAQKDKLAHHALRRAWEEYGMKKYLDQFLEDRPPEYRESLQNIYRRLQEVLKSE